MLIFESLSVLVTVICWVVATGFVGACLQQIAKRIEVNPEIWWAGLLITLLAFAPVPEAMSSKVDGFAWAQGDWNFAAVETQISAAMQTHVPDIDSQITVWLIGLIAAISVWRVFSLLSNHRKLHRLVRAGIPFQPEQSPYPTFLTSIPTSAFATGVRNPVVALPDYFLALPTHQQKIVLAHEYTHIRQRDPVTVFAWRMLCQLCWFNPFLRTLEKGHNQSIEMRCDANTLQHSDCSASEYARTLLACLKFDTSQSAQTLSVGFTSGMSVQDYKTRLKKVLGKPDRALPLRQLCLLLLLLIASVLGLSTAVAGLTQAQERWHYPVSHPKLSSTFGHIAAFRAHKPHRGIDLRGPVGTPVFASASGTVAFADGQTLSPGYGLVIMLQHPQQWQSMYAHLSEVRVKPGQKVAQGDLIGLMGQTGRVTGPHLHFELAHQEQVVDPLLYLETARENTNHLP